jgi:hypothetical protein
MLVYDYYGNLSSNRYPFRFRRILMQQQTMEAALSNELLADETLLWSGRPDARKRSIASPARVFRTLGLVFMPVGLLILLIGLILLFSPLSPSGFQPGMLGLVIPGGVFFILGVVYLIIGLVGFSSSGNTLYAITNQRAIIVRPGRYVTVSSYNKRSIGQVQRIERADGSGDLIFANNAPYGSYGNTRYNTNSVRFGRPGFYALPDVRSVEQILLRMMNEEP